jgi:diguanylate cyclase (GGDEF)-like protein
MATTSLRQTLRDHPTGQRGALIRPVLLIEDQRSLSEMLASMLRAKWGCDVFIAASLGEARELLAEHGSQFMAAVCDLNLPDAPFGEAIDLVNQHQIPAIALTGTISPDVRNLASQGSIVDYVLKKGMVSYEYVVQLVGRLHRNASLKVLVADDSAASREVIKRMLGVQRLNVLLAQNGAEALYLLNQHPDIKLVLVDYNMPKVDGFEFVMQARRNMGKDRLSIIGISGENRADVSAQFLKHGANDFISKPYSYEEMTCRVNQNLEMLELVESMQTLANRDYLTGLWNRRYFFDQGNAAHKRGQKQGSPLFVAMMDIDHFKQINDTYGHSYGDQVLKHVADCIRLHFPDDLVARLGGEEFAVLFTGADVAVARQRLEAFRSQLASRATPSAPGGAAVTISLGGCDLPHSSLDDMLKVADQHLYQAKQNGRNQLVG